MKPMIRILFGLLLGVLMMPATFSGAMAAQARIGDFHDFECNTPDGERLKPKFGDIDGVLYTDLPAQREACHETIDRKIALCEQNTSFASNTEDREHAGCLPIFEKQAQACIAFFKGERGKCDAGGTSAADGESGANAQAAEVALSPMCPDEDDTGRCWAEVANKPGCYAFDFDMEYRSSGVCENGLASGEWRLTYADGEEVETGRYVEGKRHGHWVESSTYFGVAEGSYRNGKAHGRWVARRPDGKCYVTIWSDDEVVEWSEC